MQLLTTVDADEVSPVRRAANRKRFVLKEDGEVQVETEIADIMAVPWEREGAMIDSLRKEDADEAVVKAAVGAMRLLTGIADELPDGMREAVEKLGTEIYTRTNPPLNTTSVPSPTDLDGSSAGSPKDGTAPKQTDLDGSGRDGELSGNGSAPKVAADTEDDDEDDVAKAYFDEDMEKSDRTFSAGTRRGYAKRGVAMADGSFPIPDADALRRAKLAVGRANPSKRSAVRAHINSRAKALGLQGLGQSDVSKEDEAILELAAQDNRLLAWVQKAMRRKPKDSGEEPDDKEPDDDPDDTTDAVEKGDPVADTHAVPIKKEDGSWDLSGIPEESRPFYNEMIQKADETTVKLEKAETELAETREALRTKEIIAKADTQFKSVGARDDIVTVLKEAGDKLTPEGYESLVSLLSAANERIETGDLFKEAGFTGGASGEGGDAWGKIEKAAEAIVEKGDGDISKAQAVDRVLKTAEGAALYNAYMRETGLGVS